MFGIFNRKFLALPLMTGMQAATWPGIMRINIEVDASLLKKHVSIYNLHQNVRMGFGKEQHDDETAQTK